MKIDHTLIDKYLRNELSDEDQIEFNHSIESDTAFAEEFAFQKSTDIYLEGTINKANLTKKLEKIGEDFFKEKTSGGYAKIIKNKFLLGIVSVAAIGLLFLMINPFSSQDLYQNYANHRNLAIIVKSDNSDWAKKSEHDFNTQNYKQAIVDLKAYLKEYPDNQRAFLSLGISFLETNQNEEAIRVFSKIKEGNSTLKNYGTWYLALTHVKNKDFAKAKKLLKKIPSSDANLFTKAKELMNNL